MDNLLTLVSALFGTGAAAMLIVQLVKKGLTAISNRYGALVTQVVLLGVSFVVALGAMALRLLPQDILISAGAVFASAMAIYEILWKGLIQQALQGK